MTVRDVSSTKAPGTYLGTFEPQREQRVGEDGNYDQHLGRSPLSRWIAFAFDYEDFELEGSNYVVKHQLPQRCIATRALLRVDAGFTGITAANIGDDNDPDGWFASQTLAGAGVFRAAGAYNTAGFAYDGGQIVVDAGAAAPTVGQGIVFVEVISYNEALGAEW